MLYRAIIISAIITGLSIYPAFAEKGTWSTTDSFAQVNIACTRVYTCWPSETIMYDADSKIVIDTPNKLVWGVCSGFDSCDVCLTTEPEEPCEWHLEKK